MTRIVLASASPRREQLMRQVGLTFKVIPSDIDEDAVEAELAERTPPGEFGPQCLVIELARQKARSVAASLQAPDTVVVGADTVVSLGYSVHDRHPREILGKPEDEDDARRMLRLLSGTWHRVDSCVATASAGDLWAGYHATYTMVKFRELSLREIDAYIASGEPMDKAGAYGIQELGATLVERIEGDYFTVVGLSLVALSERLKHAGIHVL